MQSFYTLSDVLNAFIYIIKNLKRPNSRAQFNTTMKNN